MTKSSGQEAKIMVWRGSWFLLLILLCCLTFLKDASGAYYLREPKKPTKDIVIVIDLSTSMGDIFNEVKEEAKKFIEGANVGDRVVIVTFGETARLSYRTRIKKASDVELVKKHIDSLVPVELASYLSVGLQRGMEVLREFYQEYPDHERYLLWLSDEKDNPPDIEEGKLLTLEDVKKQSASFAPEADWFEYTAPIKEGHSLQVNDFVQWAKRSVFLVKVYPDRVDLGLHKEASFEGSISLSFAPQSETMEGLPLQVVGEVRSKNEPEKVFPLEISPGIILCRSQEWQEEFHFSILAQPGEYEGFLTFSPSMAKTFSIKPEAVPFTFAVEQPLLAEEEKPKPGEPAERLLAGLVEKEPPRPPGTERPIHPIPFEAVEPGRLYRKTISLFPTAPTKGEHVKFAGELQLPEGLELSTRVRPGLGNNLFADIFVSVSQEFFLRDPRAIEKSFELTLNFATEEGAKVLPLNIPVMISFNKESPRWGEPLLPQEGFFPGYKAKALPQEEIQKALAGKQAPAPVTKPPLKERLKWDSLKARFLEAVRTPFLWLLLALIMVFLSLLMVLLKPKRALIPGKLISIKSPEGMEIRPIDFRKLPASPSAKQNIITIGRGKKADVRLDHPSLASIHCSLVVSRVDGEVVFSLQPERGQEVKINGHAQSIRTQLYDDDLLELGDFIFQVKLPQPRRQIVSRFNDGRTLRGTPVTWNLASDSFLLKLEEPSAFGEEVTVRFKDLKAVFFVQEFSPESGMEGLTLPPGMARGQWATMAFKDGEKLEGYTLKDYRPSETRFYILPKKAGNVVSILVERSSLATLQLSEAHKPWLFISGLFSHLFQKAARRGAP